MNQNDLPIGVQRHAKHPRLRTRQVVAVADDVEDNAREVESNQSTQQRRHGEQEQVRQVAAVGTDERPHAHDQAEDVARTQSPRVGKRDLAGGRGRGDCRFSVQFESRGLTCPERRRRRPVCRLRARISTCMPPCFHRRPTHSVRGNPPPHWRASNAASLARA